MKEVTIYTDGACSGNPGPGGWGAVLIYGDKRKELSGAEPSTTNQRMEITAAIAALRVLKEPCRVHLYSDSAYLINAFRQGWLARWERNGWLTVKKQPVENQDLWRELLQVASRHQVEWLKVKGHSDNPENNRCDELARAAIAALRRQEIPSS
ncbi:ribonuclease HI [Neomoorella thermoacetica]|uniref:ribonuclease HI n=1 Tax=Neomoorella thermoacetica TaxID=1525 RepID=UPI0008FB959A|nr:ribonuclease HI [Moorella thermoacetica]APC07740.1 ribonuclease H [Moorella thermoacetica]OIQ53555.1 ribonuclease H [Moorella thermoacetica]